MTGQFGYPPDCTKFINCYNGGPFLQSCAPGTRFDVRNGRCDWPYNAQCATYSQSPLQWSIGA